MPSSGKSTIGKLLARVIGYSFVDTDKLIEQEADTSIAQIFSLHGEAYFRQQEKELLPKLAQRKQTVIATGGGFPCFNDNMAELLRIGTVIFLDSEVRMLTKLLAKKAHSRPLLANTTQQELTEKIMAIREMRLQYYLQAHHVISIFTETPISKIIEEIEKKI